VVRFLKASGINYPATRPNTQEDPVPQYNSFATNKILQRCHFQWVMGQTSRMASLAVLFFLCLACYISDQCLAVLWTACCGGDGGSLNRRCHGSDCLTPEDGTDRWTRNIGNQLPIYITQHPRKARASDNFCRQKHLIL
jgi:hypothetical protein